MTNNDFKTLIESCGLYYMGEEHNMSPHGYFKGEFVCYLDCLGKVLIFNPHNAQICYEGYEPKTIKKHITKYIDYVRTKIIQEKTDIINQMII